MKIWFGLGNPGSLYKNTLHNIGQFAILSLLENQTYKLKKMTALNASLLEQNIFSDTLIFFPNTFMNLSGIVIKKIIKKYNVSINDILIFHDEVELKIKDIKYKFSSSARGHNGLRDIIEHLQTKDFSRIRIGIGKPQDSTSLADYVLSEKNLNDFFSKPQLVDTLKAHDYIPDSF